jgi:hypothetical protein
MVLFSLYPKKALRVVRVLVVEAIMLLLLPALMVMLVMLEQLVAIPFQLAVVEVVARVVDMLFPILIKVEPEERFLEEGVLA